MTKNQDRVQTSVSPVLSGQDGFSKVTSLEANNFNQLLETYAARVEGYKIEDGDNYYSVTMKLLFASCDKRANAEMWAWFICKAAHPSAAKPRTTSIAQDGQWVVYLQWPIWKQVKFMESKRTGGDLF